MLSSLPILFQWMPLRKELIVRLKKCYVKVCIFHVTLTPSRYEEAKATKGFDNYDRELEEVIDRLIVECDKKITRALKRLDEEDAKAAIAISVSEVTQVIFDYSHIVMTAIYLLCLPFFLSFFFLMT